MLTRGASASQKAPPPRPCDHSETSEAAISSSSAFVDTECHLQFVPDFRVHLFVQMITMNLLEELRKAIQEPRKPLIICGAGVSTQSTNGKAPSWASLIESGIDHVLALDPNENTWAAYSRTRLQRGSNSERIIVADEVTQKLGGGRNAEFATWLENQVAALKPEKRDLLDAIVALGCPLLRRTTMMF